MKMNLSEYAQPGVISDPTNHVEYLTLVLKDNITREAINSALSSIANAEKSIRQKDATAGLTVTTCFSVTAWSTLFPDKPIPGGLSPFQEMRDGDRHFPSTPGDIFFMVKSSRLDLNYQVTKHLYAFFKPIATAIEDIQGFSYLDGRDLIDFVDGTENPTGNERFEAVLIPSGMYKGGSFLTVQKYFDKQEAWDALSTSEQEGVVGRTKMDDIEIPDDEKKPYAHNVKSKLVLEGKEIKMLRQNRAFGNAIEHGTMFVGFAATSDVIKESLKQMIFADEQGFFDHLLKFVEAKTGTNYFVPPRAFMEELADL